jgi:hypothetical protein
LTPSVGPNAHHEETASTREARRCSGWVEVPMDYVPSADKMVNAVTVLPSRLRSRRV